jgi:hypothetical protein
VLATSSDGSTNSQNFTINVNNLNDNAPVLNYAGFSLTDGQIITLTTGDFDITDPDGNSLTYLLSEIRGGFVRLSSAPDLAATRFTDTDLSSGFVRFVHDGGNVAPSFKVTVNDGFADSNTILATIDFTAINNPVITQTPDFSQNPDSSSASANQANQFPDSLEQSNDASIKQIDLHTANGDTEVIIDLNAYIDKLISENTMAYDALTEGSGFFLAAGNNSSNPGGFSGLDKNLANEDKEHVKRRFLSVSSGLSSIDFQTIDTENSFNEDEEKQFWMHLDRISKHMDNPDLVEETKPVDIKVVLGASVSLTAGFVSWILRAGSLMASFMSTVPLLRRFDPLPILKSASKHAESDEKALLNGNDKSHEAKSD